MATTNPKEPAPKRVRPSRAKPKAEEVKKDENQLDLDLTTTTATDDTYNPTPCPDCLDFIDIRGLPFHTLYILANYLFDKGYVFGGNPFGDFHRNIEQYVLDYDYLQLHHNNKLIISRFNHDLPNNAQVSLVHDIHVDYQIEFTYPENVPEEITVKGVKYRRV